MEKENTRSNKKHFPGGYLAVPQSCIFLPQWPRRRVKAITNWVLIFFLPFFSLISFFFFFTVIFIFYSFFYIYIFFWFIRLTISLALVILLLVKMQCTKREARPMSNYITQKNCIRESSSHPRNDVFFWPFSYTFHQMTYISSQLLSKGLV